ncbi:hypothetical protein [Stenotrophomonas maltophilia]|uniref:hypothetical protein n=1 Tax=Stenotrophomonas maltophilia TaxID=40324 RepID=UPI0039C221E3
MTETANAVTICSNALLSLGDRPIASFDEGQASYGDLDRAKLCSALYPQVRKSVLRSHPWNCAIRRVQLSPDAAPPAFGFTNRFLLPGDWLRTLAVGDRGVRIDFRAEGRYLLSDAVVFPLTYIADVPENTWDAMLIDVMTGAMAARLAYPITKSAAMIETKTAELRALMQTARAVDGQDDPPETLGDFPLMTARLGGYGWGSMR